MAEVLNVFDTINFNHGGPTALSKGNAESVPNTVKIRSV